MNLNTQIAHFILKLHEIYQNNITILSNLYFETMYGRRLIHSVQKHILSIMYTNVTQIWQRLLYWLRFL